MTEPFDCAQIVATMVGCSSEDTDVAYWADYLRTRIEAAFVPVEHHVSVIADHDELLQREIARAEAAEAAFVPVEDVARIMGDELGRVHLSPDQAIRLLCLACLLRSGELSLRANDSDDARAACELIDDIAQEIALQVSHQKDHIDE